MTGFSYYDAPGGWSWGEEYEQALQIDDNFASSHLGRSWAFSQLGRYEKALAELDVIRGDLPPGYSEEEIQVMKSYFLSRAGRYQEADVLLRQVESRANEVENRARSGMTHLLESLIELEKGAPTRALAAAERAAEVLPADGRSSRSLRGLMELLLGIAAARTGDLSRAHEHLLAPEKQHDPRNNREKWWYHLLLGETLLARGNTRGAYTAFTDGAPQQKMILTVTRLFRNLSGALSFRDSAARAKAQGGDCREAIALYEELVRPDIGQKVDGTARAALPHGARPPVLRARRARKGVQTLPTRALAVVESRLPATRSSPKPKPISLRPEGCGTTRSRQSAAPKGSLITILLR